MKLYFAPGACSLSPHIVLREAGFNFDLDRVATRPKVQEAMTVEGLSNRLRKNILPNDREPRTFSENRTWR
jgi:hypothetical protein